MDIPESEVEERDSLPALWEETETERNMNIEGEEHYKVNTFRGREKKMGRGKGDGGGLEGWWGLVGEGGEGWR